MLPTNHVIDLIPGYALGCLNEEEKLQVAEHLKGCESCRLELDSYQHIVDELHQAAPAVAPPPDLKQKILLGVQQKPALDKFETKLSGWERLWNRLQHGAPVWAYASFVLVIILATSNIWMLQTRQPPGSQQPGRIPHGKPGGNR